MANSHEDFSRIQHVQASSNRVFGGVFTAIFLIVALWPIASGHELRWWALTAGGLLLLVTIVAPALLTIPNRLWTRFGLLLNRIISPVALGILFYVAVTPMGLVMRAFGKDPMRLQRSESAETYWIKREPPGPEPESMSEQF